MRGLDRLAQLRRSRLKPPVVHLDMPDIGLSSGLVMEGQLLVEAGDSPTTQDLRILHDLRVIAMGRTGDFERIEAWARAAIRAEARDVAVAVFLADGTTDGPLWIRVNGETLE